MFYPNLIGSCICAADVAQMQELEALAESEEAESGGKLGDRFQGSAAVESPNHC